MYLNRKTQRDTVIDLHVYRYHTVTVAVPCFGLTGCEHEQYPIALHRGCTELSLAVSAGFEPALQAA